MKPKNCIDVVFVDYQIENDKSTIVEFDDVCLRARNNYEKDNNTIFYNTNTFLKFYPDIEKDLLWNIEPVPVLPANFEMEVLKYFPAVFNWNRKLLEKVKNGIFIPHCNYKCVRDFENFNHIILPFEKREREILFISNYRESLHNSGLYKLRVDAADWFYLNSDFKVSWYGSKELNRPYYKGKIENKTERITQSQFLFCPENCYDEYYSWDYLTEKLFDGFVGQAIPIYAGCYNIDSYIPNDLYVDLRKFNNSINGNLEIDFNKLYETLCVFDNNGYYKMQESINRYILQTPKLFTDRFSENIYKDVIKKAKNYFVKKSIFGYDGGGRENEKQRIEDEQIFAGDYYIKYELEKLINKFGVKSIVETGTAEGKSTLEMSSMVNNVYTIEINEKSYNVAQERLNKSKNVKMYLGNSPEVLRSIIEEIEYPALFYLDAHWFNYWPILDELEIISQSNHADETLIFIHDFVVPNTNYGYDIYNNQPLDIKYIKEKLFKINKSIKYFYNKKALGKKRGVLYAHPAEILSMNNPLVQILIDNAKQTNNLFNKQTYKNVIVEYVETERLQKINSCIMSVDSEFVFYSKNGNLYDEEIIANCLKTLKTNPSYDILFINEKSDNSSQSCSDLLKLTKLRDNDFIIRRHVFEEIGFFDELINDCFEFLIRFFEANKFNIGIMSVQGNKTVRNTNNKQQEIFNKFISKKPIDLIFSDFNWDNNISTSKANSYLILGLCLIELNDFTEGIKYFGMSFSVVPNIDNLIQITNALLLKEKVSELYLLIKTVKENFKEKGVIKEIEELLSDYIKVH